MSRRMSQEPRATMVKVDKTDRRLAHHRERQATRSVLLAEDPDAIVAPTVVRTAGRHRPPEPSRPHRRFRHWKAPFWKRRTAERRQRNLAFMEIAQAD